MHPRLSAAAPGTPLGAVSGLALCQLFFFFFHPSSLLPLLSLPLPFQEAQMQEALRRSQAEADAKAAKRERSRQDELARTRAALADPDYDYEDLAKLGQQVHIRQAANPKKDLQFQAVASAPDGGERVSTRHGGKSLSFGSLQGSRWPQNRADVPPGCPCCIGRNCSLSLAGSAGVHQRQRMERHVDQLLVRGYVRGGQGQQDRQERGQARHPLHERVRPTSPSISKS